MIDILIIFYEQNCNILYPYSLNYGYKISLNSYIRLLYRVLSKDDETIYSYFYWLLNPEMKIMLQNSSHGYENYIRVDYLNSRN